MTTMELGTRNPAYASEDQAKQVAAHMAKLGELGWTRPDILAAFGQLDVVGVTDSVVYRAQREKIHTVELPIFKVLFDAIEAGTVKPRVKSRKLKVADVADKAYAAAALLATLGDKPKAAELAAIVQELKTILPEPKVDEPEADNTEGDDGNGDANGDDGNGDGNGENPDA